MKKFMCIILPLAICITFSGCYDSQEISRIAFILAVGFDKDSYSFQIAKPSAFEGEGSEDSPLLTTTIYAPNVYIAMDKLNSSISEKCDYSHIKMAVFSKDKLEKGIEKEVYAMLNSNDFHPNIRVAMCEDKASGYMEDMEIPLDANPAEFYENIFKENFTEYAPDVQLKDMQKQYKTQVSGNVLPVMNKTNSGMAIIKDYKLNGNAKSDEVFLYNLLKEKNFEGNYQINDGIVATVNKKNHKFNVDLSSKAPIVSVKLCLTGSIIWAESNINKEKISQDAQKKLQREVTEFLNKCSLEYKTDILGLYKLARTNYLTTESWEKEDWQGLFQRAKYKVTVDIDIRE